ncbi:MAG: galactosyldiacylglycerol synthase [Clostridia bacterium]|nr:galactosyldiacylglycerol synthase [Clostridia bacterium]
MKVLIISVKAGFGHHSTARAIIDYLTEKDISCEMLDTFEYINPMLADSIDNGYLFSTKHFPDLYGKAYDMLDKRDEKWDKRSPIAVLSKLVSHKLKDFITDYNPDVIVGTHSYACMLMTYLREKNIVTCPLIGIITDFTVHPFWESTELDYYVTADSLLEIQLKKKGIPPKKMLPYGIPIRHSFSEKLSKEDARSELGIENKTTILIMMGSMGFGNIVKDIKSIDELEADFQILCVCGNNEKMLHEIEEKEWNKTVIPFGFVQNVDVMMDAADLIITKPGGLTTSEFLAKKLPAVIMNPIRGQEDRNTEFLVNYGAAIMVTETFGLDEALYELLKSPWRMKLLTESVEHLGKPNSTHDVCEFILNLIGEESDGE